MDHQRRKLLTATTRSLGIQSRVKPLRSSYTGLYPRRSPPRSLRMHTTSATRGATVHPGPINVKLAHLAQCYTAQPCCALLHTATANHCAQHCTPPLQAQSFASARRRIHSKGFNNFYISQGLILALPVLCMPHSPDSGPRPPRARLHATLNTDEFKPEIAQYHQSA